LVEATRSREYQSILLGRHRVGIATVLRKQSYPITALSKGLNGVLNATFTLLPKDRATRVVVLAGNANCAGHDRMRLALNKAYEYAAEVMALGMTSEEAVEGFDAFIDKQKPAYRDR
jgi:enoyl-CoA hydratase/carnithine racemase